MSLNHQITSELTLEIWSMHGVLEATCGSNPLGVDDENEFPKAPNPTQIYQCKQGKYKLHKHECICITIKL